ncbi:MAG: cytochrome P450 [Pseudomonadota bacterium]|nr:cytochrome P450 [Pseudomonadota bacterium]
MTFRKALRPLAIPVIHAMVPFKTWAWTTRRTWLRGLILEITSLIDFLLVGMLVQNNALMMTFKAFGGGNFFFGRALMVTDHASAAAAVVKPQLRGSLFMGLPIVGYAPSTFMSNAGPISVSQPARRVLRRHLDDHVVSDAHRSPDIAALRADCADVLSDWAGDPRRDTLWSLRGTAARMLARILADVDVPKAEMDAATAAYLRRFGELSAFSYYAPFMLSLLGTHETIRRDVFLPLKRHGIDPLVVDMIMFAGMFSVGTIVMKCVEYTRVHDVDYASLSHRERLAFVVESLRLFPTVSTVHRIVEESEQVAVGKRMIDVRPGCEIAYPFVCIHRNAEVFGDPEAFRLDRPAAEVAQILSWSRGPNMCPVRDLSVVVTVLMLDTLAESAGDLRRLDIYNIEF